MYDDDPIFERWRRALGAGDPRRLDRRLAWDYLDQANAREVFEQDQQRFYWDTASIQSAPEWAVTLATLQAAIKASAGKALVSAQDSPAHCGAESLPFCDLWQPAVDAAVELLRLHIGPLFDGPRAPQVAQQMAGVLLARLCRTAQNALWDLFQIERGAGISVLAHFRSAEHDEPSPPRQAYWRFIQRHREDGLATVLMAFPVLGRLLADVVRFWLDSSAEMLIRIHQDRRALEVRFGLPMTAMLDNIRLGLGDHHCQGRTVASLGFSDGDLRWDIVYKPRDMRIDFEFQRLLGSEAILAGLPPLASSAVWYGEDYGYMEFVRHVPCRDPQELALFYTNAGRLGAWLYVLGCTDGHHENLIACGSNLFFIDAETLLTPTLKTDIDQYWALNIGGKPKLEDAFQASIARTELLPSWVFIGPQRQAIDLSALGAEPTCDKPISVPGWLSINSDLMVRGTVQTSARPSAHAPVPAGRANPFTQYQSHFNEGFRAQCRAIIQCREALLAPGGLLDRFAGLSRRIVFRATRVYFAIQAQQLEPASLRSVLEHRLRLEQLARLYLTASSRPINWPVFAQERQHMAQLDIPYFVHRTDDTGLFLGQTQKQTQTQTQTQTDKPTVIEDLFETSGLENCRQRIKHLDLADVEFQLQIVEGLTAAKHLRIHVPFIPGNQDQQRPNGLRTHRLARSVRERVVRGIASDILATARGNGTEWLGFDLAEDCQRYQFQPLGLSLYSGAAGIAMFLASLANSKKNAGKPDAQDLQVLAQRILQPLWRFDDKASCDSLRRWWRDQPLGLAGAAGQLLALQAFDAMCQEGAVQSGGALAEKIVEGLDESLIAVAPLTLIDGIAGLVGVLLMLNTEKSNHVAMAIGDRLAEYRAMIVTGSRIEAYAVGSGFADGAAAAANIVASLGQLHLRTGIDRYLDAARMMLARSREGLDFDPQSDEWYDQHGSHGGWFSGLSGMVIGRLCLFGTALWDAQVEREVAVLLNALSAIAARSGSPRGDRFGTIAVLRMANDLLNNTAWKSQADSIEAASNDAPAAGERSFVFSNTQGPCGYHLGLINGLSGIGLILIDEPHSRSTVMTLLSSGLLGFDQCRLKPA